VGTGDRREEALAAVLVLPVEVRFDFTAISDVSLIADS
jgi:hypothetical protein